MSKRLYIFSSLTDAFSTLIVKEKKLLLISLGFLFAPLLAAFIYSHINPDIIYAIGNDFQVKAIKNNFDPALAASRIPTDIATDLSMLQFYIINNAGMGLRIFIAGLLVGLGTLLLLVYQGISMGLLMGYVSQLGFGEVLWPFIIGHSSLELLASVFSSIAGLIIGRSIIWPTLDSRLKSFTTEFRHALTFVLLATILFIIAACIETFWSSNIGVDNTIKYFSGASLWLLIIYIFYRAFKNHEHS